MSALGSAVFHQDVRSLLLKAVTPDDQSVYRAWARRVASSRAELAAQRRWAAAHNGVFSVITFVEQPERWRPQPTAASLFAQSYPRWEWVLVVARESMEAVEAVSAPYRQDRRVRLVGVGESSTRAAAWNVGLRESRGEFAALLDQEDALSPDALFYMAKSLEAHPDTDVLYSDEDRTSGEELQRFGPRFKPDWSPELLLSGNYIGRLTMLRIAAATSAGGFRDSGAATEWELFLRLSRRGARFRRVPRCVYHRRSAAEELDDGSALRDHYSELGLEVAVVTANGATRLLWPVQGTPTVSIIIPNRNAAAVFARCLTGLLHETSYRRCEIVIVDNGSTDAEVLKLYKTLESRGQARVVPFSRPFNFSAACNAGAAAAHGDLFLFLNNDIEVIHADWLDELIRWAQHPHTGIVGAKLLYPNRRIQHAGVVFGLGLVGHIFAGAPEGTSTLFGSTESYRNYLAVTGACQMMRREVFLRLGGYDEGYRLSFSDVVLCLQAWKAGYRVVYTPHARLVHHESFTRTRKDSSEDLERLARHLHQAGLTEDPYYHPELNPKASVPAVRPPFDPTPTMVVRDEIQRALAVTSFAAE